ncbi:nephrin-like [Panulirus ornatus]|uniref:nephrin-like n=1 Tax=Panulirus ornatus TaxID=150431 RepID=UPI003A8445A6
MALYLVYSVYTLLVLSVPQGVVGEEDEQQMFRVRPESVQVLAGEDVVLKCVVENQQGKAQWTKDGFALGFQRHVPGYPRYQYLGDPRLGEHHLLIRGVTLEDDGEYQCQVGPTTTISPIWAAANLTVMVSPTSISVVGVVDGADVKVAAGERLQLECVVTEARPPPTVAWYRDAIPLPQGMHQEVVEASTLPRRWNVRSRLLLRPTAKDDGQQYSCRALHPALRHSPTTLVASVNLAVLHPPGPPVIQGYHTGELLLEGEQRRLACLVEGGRPRPWVTWYRHGRPLNLAAATHHHLRRQDPPTATPATTTTTTNIATQSAKGVVRVWQLVTAAREEDGAVYECRVSNDLLTHPFTANVTLTVHYGPSEVTVYGPSVVAAGQVLTLTCRSSPANPPATLTWRFQGSRVASGTTVVSEEEGGGWVTSAQLTHHLPRSQEVTQVTAECQATHPASRRPASTAHTITVIKRPGWPVVEVGRVVAGDQLPVLCTSQGGNPTPALTLYKAGHQVAATVEQVEGGVTRARATLQVTPADNGQQVTCQVTNPATTTPIAAHATINLLFPAWEVSGWVTPGSVEAGGMAALTCETSSSVPPSTVSWSSAGATLGHATATQSPGLYGGTVTRSELKILTRPQDNGRTFTCEADNGLGVTVAANVTLNVLHGPMWAWAPTGRLDVTEGDDLTITAHATANPGPVRYSWWRGPAAVGGDDTDGGDGKLTLTQVDRHMSGNYTVIAHSSWSSINSSFTINVQFGPEDVLAAERVVVDEDGTATVLCSATGNPPPNVTWTRDTDNTSSAHLLSTGIGEASLVVEWASQADTGIYFCHASNTIASSPPISTAIIVTQAPTSATQNIEGEEMGRLWAPIGGSGWLDCRVRAAPAPSFKWTTSRNDIISNSKKYFIHVPQLVDKVAEWSSLLEIRHITAHDYTDYTCTAHNSRGSYTMNFTLSPPLLPGTPKNLNITILSSDAVSVTWMHNYFGARAVGFTIRYQATDAPSYEFVDVPGSNSTATTIKDLMPGSEYSFAILAYNEHGHSDYSFPSIKVTMLGMVEEVASSSSVDGRQPRVPRLILLLICLTTTALLVLNISIIVCYVRRRAIKRNISASSSKTTASEIYTPTSGCAIQGDELPLTSFNDGPPPEYQYLECQTKVEECEQTSLISPRVSPELPDSHTTQTVTGASPRSRSTSPLLNGGVIGQNDMHLHENNIVPSEGTVNMSIPATSPKQEKTFFNECSAPKHFSNNPDVCPVTSSSCDPLLPEQESFNLTSEEDQASLLSDHSSESHGFSSGQIHLKQHSPCQLPRATTHVIYHGQPHIQQKLEQQHWQHYQQSLPCCQQISPSPKDKPSHTPVSSLHSSLNHSATSSSPSGCCDATWRQSLLTAVPMRYATLQPRRSCLKPSRTNVLQRSHSAHSYTYSSMQCVYEHPVTEMKTNVCYQKSICGNPQLASQQTHVTQGRRAQEFPIYFARSKACSRGCTRHNSISGHVGYKNTPYKVHEWSPVPPDLCKVDSSSTKRVGWKEIIPDSPGQGTPASRGSADTSTSSTTSTVTLGPTRFPQHYVKQDNTRSNGERNIGPDNQR